MKLDERERLERDLARQRLLQQERERAEELRREKLLADVEQLAQQFQHAPEHVGHYVQELQDAGMLRDGDAERAYDRIAELAGWEFAERAFGFEPGEDTSTALLQAVAAEWRTTSEEMAAARQASQVVDADVHRQERTLELLERIAGFLGLNPAEVPVRVDEEAAARTDARGASGLMDDGVVYLHPRRYDPETTEGRELLGHEVVHVAQRAETSVTPSVAPSKIGAEREAASLAGQFARGAGIGRPEQVLPAMDRAADTDTDAASGDEPSGSMPTDFKVTLGGREIEIDLPSDAQPGRVTVRDVDLGVRGLTVDEVELRFSSSWEFERGTVKGHLQIGEYVNIENLELSINDRKQVEASVEGVEVALGSYINATLDLRISGSGTVSGQATITADQVNIGHGVNFDGGTVTLTLGEDGSLSASGNLTATLEGVGSLSFTLAIGPNPETGTVGVSGRVEITLQENLQVYEGVTIESGTITGSFNEEEGFTAGANVSIKVREWATGQIEASYKHTGGLWSAKGTLTQGPEAPLTLGEGEHQTTVTQGEVTLELKDNELVKATGKCHLDHQWFEGDLEGEYKIQEEKFSLDGKVNQKEGVEIPLGQGGAVLKSSSGTLTVADNVLTEVKITEARAEVPYENEPTFEVTAKEATLKVQEGKFSGTGTVKTMRELTFGDVAKTHVKVAEGATGDVTVENNSVKAINSGLEFSVLEGESEIGTGTVSLNFENEGEQSGKVGGTGTFRLTDDYGYPDREAGPVWVKKDASITVTLENSAVKEVKVENVAFEIVNVTAEGIAGKIEGTFSGSMDFSTGELNCEGSAQVTEKWPLSVEWGTFEFTKGGEIDVKVEKSKLQTLTGDIPFRVEIVREERKIGIKGNLNGSYSEESGKFSGKLEGTLEDDITIKIGKKGDTVVVKKDSTASAEVAENKFDKLGLNVHVEYNKDGKVFLEGHVENGEYLVQDGKLSFDGKVTLKQKIEKATKDGKWTFIVQSGTELTVKVGENQLKEIGGELQWEVHDKSGPLLKGSLTEAKLGVEDWKFSGKFDVKTARPFQHPREDTTKDAFGEEMKQFLQLIVDEGSGFTGTIKDNSFEEFGANIQVTVKYIGEDLLKGNLKGSYNLTNETANLDGDLTLVKEWKMSSDKQQSSPGKLETMVLYISKGSTFGFKIAESKLQTVKLDASGGIFNENLESVCKGHLKGDYELGTTDGFEGDAELTFHKDYLLAGGEEGATLDYYIKQGTTFKAVVSKSKVQSAEGEWKLLAREGSKDKLQADVKANYTPETLINGTAKLTVLDDMLISDQGNGYKLYLAKDSGGDATVDKSTITEVGGKVLLMMRKGEEDFAKGEFEVDYKLSEGTNAEITANGKVELIGEIDMTPQGVGDKNWHFWLVGGTGVDLQITKSALDYIDGAVKMRIDEGESPAVDVDITGKYTEGETPDFSGKGTATVTRPVDTGVVHEGYKLWIDEGAGVGIEIANMKLAQLDANVPLLIKNPTGEDLWKIQLKGTYIHAEGGQGKFEGSGSAELLKQIKVAEGITDKNLKIFLEPGTGVQAKVTQNVVTEATGTLKASIHDTAGEFLFIDGSATYSNEEGGKLVKASASVNVTRDYEMLTTKKGYKAYLEPTTGAHIEVENNLVKEISGTVKTRLDDSKGKGFVRVELEGKYTDTEGFTGSGKASLLQEYYVGQVGDYKIYVLPSTAPMAQVDLVGSDITHVGGKVEGRIDDKQGKFIKLSVEADYDFPGKLFSGRGSAEVIGDRKLGEVSNPNGAEQLWLCKGTGATVVVTENNLDQVGGKINVELRDGGDPATYLKVEMNGTFDAKGGTGFSGGGSVTVTRRKRLMESGGYAFWLAKGAGAKATIKENKLTEVSGKVPFEIFTPESTELPLLEGSAEGQYVTKTGKFSGSGDIRLGRDVEYSLGSGGAKLVFKKGSGGNASVKDNELRKLGGKLDVDIWDSEGKLLNVHAEGEYDAVKNKIIYVEGGAKLYRPFEPIEGLIIKDVHGSARVEDNELKWAKGGGTIVVEPLNNMTGTFEVSYRNGADGEKYSGKGKINFTMFDEPETGRKMWGEVDAEYNEDDTFRIKGDVSYNMNEMIGGTIGVEVTEELDPKLNGELRVSGVKLVEGQDLFKMNQKLFNMNQQFMAGPVPIAVNMGANLGLSLAMNPLLLDVTVGVENFYPLKGNLPDFEARGDLHTGLTFKAALIPYASVGLGVTSVASVGLRLQGELAVLANMDLNPYVIFRGGPQKDLSGELGVGLKITGSASLSLTPQVYAELLTKVWPYDIDTYTIDFGDLFSYEWNTAYKWGDSGQEPATEGGSTKVDAGTASGSTRKTAGLESEPSMSEYSQPQTAGPVKGGPDLGSAEDREPGDKKGSGGMGELQQKMEEAKEFAGKIGRIAKVAGELVNILTMMVTIPQPFGTAVAGIYLAYLHLSGELTFGDIKQAALDLWSLIEELDIPSLIRGLLPEWLVNLWDQIQDKGLGTMIDELVDNAAGWLKRQFPDWSEVVDAIADGLKTARESLTTLISGLVNGNLSVSDFLEVAAAMGASVGRVIAEVAEQLGEEALEMVADVADAVGAAASWLGNRVGDVLGSIGDAVGSAVSYLNPFD